jgi:putative oxidoreductase
MNSLDQNRPLMLSVLRIMSGLLFLAHGTQKYLSFPGGERAGSGWALDNPAAFAGIVEFGAGLLIALGLFTRPAAFLASGTMAVAYFIGHMPTNFWPVNNMGDAAILYCFVVLYLVFAGPGPLSLDALRAQKGR